MRTKVPLEAAPSERRRAIVGAAAGLAGGSAAAFLAPWELAILTGWDVAAASLLGSIWWSVGRLDADETRRLATREDDSRAAARVVVVVACLASIVGVLLGIRKARASTGALEVILSVASVLAVVLAWATVHTVFMLRYAHRYYDIDGGLSFPGSEPPAYRDFAYVGFTIGMTYQVSDTEVADRPMRAIVLRHALLSFLFGTVIIGLTINVLGSLLG